MSKMRLDNSKAIMARSGNCAARLPTKQPAHMRRKERWFLVKTTHYPISWASMEGASLCTWACKEVLMFCNSALCALSVEALSTTTILALK